MNNQCDGCLTYKNNEGDYCKYSVHNNKSEGFCPCVECIVKSMCEDTCDKFEEWINS